VDSSLSSDYAPSRSAKGKPRPSGEPDYMGPSGGAASPGPLPNTPSMGGAGYRPSPAERLDNDGPHKAEMLSRMDKMRRGDRVLPPCDRCRRLQVDCSKNLTACLGCTRKHAKCSWRDVADQELIDNPPPPARSHVQSSVNGGMGDDAAGSATSDVLPRPVRDEELLGEDDSDDSDGHYDAVNGRRSPSESLSPTEAPSAIVVLPANPRITQAGPMDTALPGAAAPAEAVLAPLPSYPFAALDSQSSSIYVSPMTVNSTPQPSSAAVKAERNVVAEKSYPSPPAPTPDSAETLERHPCSSNTPLSGFKVNGVREPLRDEQGIARLVGQYVQTSIEQQTPARADRPGDSERKYSISQIVNTEDSQPDQGSYNSGFQDQHAN